MLPAGTYKALIAKLAAIKGEPYIAYGIPSEAAANLDTAVQAWERNHSQLAKQLVLEDGDGEFSKGNASLQKAVDDAVRGYVQAGACRKGSRRCEGFRGSESRG
jgi:hypothetical protein